MRALRVRISDAKYEQLQQSISHHGEISFILRRAVDEFIREKREAEIRRAVKTVALTKKTK